MARVSLSRIILVTNFCVADFFKQDFTESGVSLMAYE